MLQKVFFVFGILLVTFLSFSDDKIWQDRNSKEGAKKAYEYYESEFQKKKTYESAWKFSRAARFYAHYFVKDIEAKKKIFEKAKDVALEATKVDPLKPEGHYYLGVAYGSWAEANGVLQSLAYAQPIVDEMTKVIQIDPDFREGAAYMVRGRVYHKAPGWPISIGDKEKAKNDFEKAIKYQNRAAFRYYAEFLIDQGQKEKAKEIIQKGLSLPFNEEDKIVEEDEIAKLKELEKKLK